MKSLPFQTLAFFKQRLKVFVDVFQKTDEKKDDFISRVAEKVASKLSTNDSQEKLGTLVNATSDRLVAKMNASHGNVDTFKSQLLKAVKEVQYTSIKCIFIPQILMN